LGIGVKRGKDKEREGKYKRWVELVQVEGGSKQGTWKRKRGDKPSGRVKVK